MLFAAMVGDVNIFMNDLDDPHVAEIEIMIAEPKRYLIWLSFLELVSELFGYCHYHNWFTCCFSVLIVACVSYIIHLIERISFICLTKRKCSGWGCRCTGVGERLRN